MSRAYIIEVYERTAGIVTNDGHGFSFFSSERAFDSLEGRHFRSAREAERAARALCDAEHHHKAHSAAAPAAWSIVNSETCDIETVNLRKE